MSLTIDLNSDLGEHPDSLLDAQIMPYISSCNIACGGHAGDKGSVRSTIKLAIKSNVAIGAHPSFPDHKNFGRKIIHMKPTELKLVLREQILLVKSEVEKSGESLHHVKPHGALYNLASIDKDTALLISEVVLNIDPQLKLYGLAQSVSEVIAQEKSISFIGEAFADRRYEADKTLQNRNSEDSVIHNEVEILAQAEALTFSKKVLLKTGWLDINAQTVCLHSDTKGAVNLAKAIHNHLIEKGAIITSV